MLNYILCHNNMVAYKTINVLIKKMQDLKTRKMRTDDKRIHTIQGYHCTLPKLVIFIHNMQDPSLKEIGIMN